MGNIFAQNSCDSVVPKECDHRHYIQSLIPNNTCPNMFCFIDHVSGCYVVFVLNRIYFYSNAWLTMLLSAQPKLLLELILYICVNNFFLL